MATKTKHQEFEDHPARVDGMIEMLRALGHVKDGQDFLSDDDRLRDLAEELQLPFLALYLVTYEDTTGLKESEVREWTAWAAEVERKRELLARIPYLVQGE